MEGTATGASAAPSPESDVIFQLKHIASTMSAWLKFLGVISMIGGAVCALSIVGIVIAWLPIWLGVLLFQAGNRAYQSQFSGDLFSLVRMLEKLKSYFIITGAITILGIAFSILSIFFISAFVERFSHEFQDMFLFYF